MSVCGTLLSSQRGPISGLRTLEVQSTEAMEDTREKAAAERAQPAGGEAFAELFEAQRGDIGRVCHRLLDDPACAEDATSEVFVRARRALSSYDPEQPFRPWLRAIASNYCIDQLRRRKTERKLFSQADLSEDGLVDASPDVLRCITRNEERREVLAAIDSLPAKYRLPLVLRFYRDLDYEAIAELLDVTRNQVGSLLFRAKKQLRERLAQGIDGIALGGGVPDREPAEPDPKARRRRRTRSPASATKTKRGAKR